MVRNSTVATALIFSLLALPVQAVDLNFSNVTIAELSQLYLKGFLKRDYVLAPEVLSDDRKSSISIKGKAESELLPFFRDFLQSHGIAVEERAGVLFLKKAAPSPASQPLEEVKQLVTLSPDSATAGAGEGVTLAEPLPIFHYRPKYRPLVELAALAQFAGATVAQRADSADYLVYSISPERNEFLVNLLADLDRPSGDVLVKAYLYEVSRTEKEGSALNAAITLLSGKLHVQLSGATHLNSISLSLPNIEAVFTALESDNRFKVISSPSLRVKHGKKSRFSVGSEVPVLDAVTQTNTGNPVQSVTYRNSGVILDITPTIHQDALDLEVNQQVSSFVPTTNGVNNSPTLIKRELLTTVSAKDGDLIFMGGLDESRNSQDANGLSFLPSWMYSKSAEQGKTDILLVLHVQRI